MWPPALAGGFFLPYLAIIHLRRNTTLYAICALFMARAIFLPHPPPPKYKKRIFEISEVRQQFINIFLHLKKRYFFFRKNVGNFVQFGSKYVLLNIFFFFNILNNRILNIKNLPHKITLKPHK